MLLDYIHEDKTAGVNLVIHKKYAKFLEILVGDLPPPETTTETP